MTNRGDIAEVLDQYLMAVEAGNAPAREALYAMHPDLAEELHAALVGIDFVHGAAPRLVPEEHTDAQPGRSLGDYRLLREIGRGGMAVVYEAEQVSLGRHVALKVLPFAAVLDPKHLQRFKNEAMAAAHLRHPNIVPVYGVGCERGVHYYAMQYIEGQSLAAAIGDLKGGGAGEGARTPISSHGSNREPAYIRMAAALGVQAAEALDHAHELGIVHRDVKPGNLLVDQAGTLWITDFGLAHSRKDVGLTITGELLGTIRYMSPEQALAKRVPVDHRTDIYSLGATLYELFTLEPAFPGDDPHLVIQDIASREPVPPRRLNPALPRDLETVILKAMSKDAGGRYATAQEMADDLQRFLEDRPVEAKRPGLLRRVVKWSQRHRALVGAATAMLLLSVAGLATGTALLWSEKERTQAALGREQDARTETQDALGRETAAREAATQERDAKGKALDEVLRLADSKKVSDLVAEEDTLWPVHPDRALAMAQWLGRATAVLKNRAEHEAALARVRERAEPYTEVERKRDHAGGIERLEALKAEIQRPPEATEDEAKRKAIAERRAALDEEVAKLEAAIAERASWRFTGEQDDWRHQVLADLLRGLDALAKTLDKVQRRHETATRLAERSIGEHRMDWDDVVRAIAASPKYGGLKIGPQLGLVPLGPDPESQLFEFAHLGSGTIPQRDPGTKRLAWAEDSAIVLVLIPGGTFKMGSQKADPGAPNFDPQAEDDASPVHEVRLSPYFVGKHEVTQAQWETMSGERPSSCHVGRVYGGKKVTLRHPVEQVTWDDCAMWLARWSLAMPTEAQWEHACRAGTDTPWWCGREAKGLQKVANIMDAFCKANGGAAVFRYEEWDDGYVVHAPVGSFAPNAFGLHDVYGNVWEWCRDTSVFGYGADAVTDPLVQGAGPRVPRGGSWNNLASEASSAYRGRSNPSERVNALGVRPARSVTSE